MSTEADTDTEVATVMAATAAAGTHSAFVDLLNLVTPLDLISYGNGGYGNGGYGNGG